VTLAIYKNTKLLADNFFLPLHCSALMQQIYHLVHSYISQEEETHDSSTPTFQE